MKVKIDNIICKWQVYIVVNGIVKCKLKNKIKLTLKSCCVKLLTAKERISFIKDKNDLPTGKAEKEREDTDYYDNSGSRQKQDV